MLIFPIFLFSDTMFLNVALPVKGERGVVCRSIQGINVVESLKNK